MKKDASHQEILAYTAGIIDGEGCLAIRECKKTTSTQYQAYVQVALTNEELVFWLRTNFGGNVIFDKSRKQEWKDQWRWKLIVREDLEPFIVSIYPYLTIKKKQAGVILSFLSSAHEMGGESFHVQMRELNKRGTK